MTPKQTLPEKAAVRPVRKAGPVAEPRRDGVRRALKALRGFARAQPLGATALLLICVFVLVALAAPWIAPHDPLEQFRRDILEPPSGTFPLGTDDLGRDVLSRTIHGARTSLIIGLATTAVSLVLGTAIGVVSGYFGRVPDLVVQRVMDAVQAVPGIVLLLFIAVILGPSVRNTIIALAVVITPSFNRIARAETLRVRQEPYVEAARATGAHAPRILALHVLPNILASVFTLGSLIFAGVIIAESALSFLGIGAPPPTPSWGLMLSEGVRYVERAPWMIIVPAVALSLAVFSFNLLGDALRDHLDPRVQRPALGRITGPWWGRRALSRLAPSLARATERIDPTDVRAGASGRTHAR
ncbi:peptide/nickel transport system permease protein [Thermocatellispora tengchongensis]|uniref:Peptide/nickel transport system permease protein n=1 Tax=Thermocatellispora tengchongensis TaxID=1073253 RepID=A0A840PK24_9ACTN|nr:ABC transporter permease [Thermocatellispora tengchongensis]MBB5139266.1 peptide/nickel transport system permease protein [Thermocatellispora tengchongensis]